MVYHRRSFRRYVSYLFYVYTEMYGAVAMLIAAVLELSCGVLIGFDNPIGILGWFAGVFFADVALCLLWSVYRSECKWAAFDPEATIPMVLS